MTTTSPPSASSTAPKTHDLRFLDELTGGAFTAPTSGERATRVREWLARGPGQEHLQEVFKELSARDKGAAKPLREKLDEIKRAKGQEAVAAEWAEKVNALLTLGKLNIADAMAWQRDAARAGAPLSKEPLATLKTQLADRVKVIEDLQHRVQVQREAAVLLAQRIEVLSMKPWRDAQVVWEALRADVGHWEAQAQALQDDANWASVDMKFPPLLEASKAQLLVVWGAFEAALAQAVAASDDATAALPPVPNWATELRLARGQTTEAAKEASRPPKPKIDPEVKALAEAQVTEALGKLESEIAQGHGKATAGAANALRGALKEHGRLIGDKLDARAHSALAAAGELEGWQRWRADQLREELVNKAEGLLKRETGQELGGRKMQELLRTLREQWKQTDQGGVPNHGLWKRFDEACNNAYKVVEAWLDKIKAESAENKAQRLALIDEVTSWAAANRTALDDDWKGFNRVLHQFGDRWRDGGHVGEKLFAEMQPLWKAAISEAAAPLEALQKQSIEVRNGMIEEAKLLGAAPELRIDAVRALQQRWQQQAHRVPLERRFEQKLWDAFRKPIDDAFNRKTLEREKAEALLGARDRTVLDAAKALEAANAGGDAQKIRAAMATLDAALSGQAQAQVDATAAKKTETDAQAASQNADKNAAENYQNTSKEGFDEENVPVVPVGIAGEATDTVANESPAFAANAAVEAANATNSLSDAGSPAPVPETVATPVAVVAPAPVRKPVVAVRGDDRPGMRKETPALPTRGGKFGDRKDGARSDRGERGDRPERSDRGDRPDRTDRPHRNGPVNIQGHGAHAPASDQPRLGDAAFRAQREALENAQFALKKLAAQAHGESIVHLLGAWEARNADAMPSAQELGSRANAAMRNAWSQAVGKAAAGDAAQSILRLEMAAETPTPAEHIAARRLLQLQLLTRRNDPPPADTWALDTTAILGTAFAPEAARRVQNALKALLKN